MKVFLLIILLSLLGGLIIPKESLNFNCSGFRMGATPPPPLKIVIDANTPYKAIDLGAYKIKLAALDWYFFTHLRAIVRSNQTREELLALFSPEGEVNYNISTRIIFYLESLRLEDFDKQELTQKLKSAIKQIVTEEAFPDPHDKVVNIAFRQFWLQPVDTGKSFLFQR